MKNAKTYDRNWETCPTKYRPRKPESTPSLRWITKTIHKYRIQIKKEQKVRNQLNVIEESIDSNHFWENWKTLNKKQHEELSNQNGDVWVNRFSNRFGPITKNKEKKHIHDQIQILESTIKYYQNPLNSPITLNELQDKIQTLQPQKRPVVLCYPKWNDKIYRPQIPNGCT